MQKPQTCQGPGSAQAKHQAENMLLPSPYGYSAGSCTSLFGFPQEETIMQDSKNGLKATQKRAHPRHKASASMAVVYGKFLTETEAMSHCTVWIAG